MLSIEEQITANIIATLEAADVEAGYPFDFTVEEPIPGTGNDPVDGKIVVQAGDGVKEAAPLNYTQYLQPWILSVVAVVSVGDDTQTVRGRLSAMAAAIEKALLTQASYQRGTNANLNGGITGINAIDTLPGEVTYGQTDPDASSGEITIVYKVRWRHFFGDPYHNCGPYTQY